MSDTPRTEANRLAWKRHEEAGVSAEFARGLERELNEANARIKRLEDALVSIKDFWNMDNNETAMQEACWHAIDTALEVLEAKESK